MQRRAMFVLGLLGAALVTAGQGAEPPTAAASAASSSCARPAVPRAAPARPDAGPGRVEQQVTVVCDAPPRGSASPAVPPEAASAPRLRANLPPVAEPRPAAGGASAPPAAPVPGMVDALVLAVAVGALVLLWVGLRVLLHALDVNLLPRAAEGARGGGDGVFAVPADGFLFRRHWGSFGGESTGWNMSARLARLLSGALLVVFAACMLVLLLHVGMQPARGPAPGEPAAARSDKLPK